MSANFVARELDYQMTAGWMQGDGAANAFFKPLETFAERFEALVKEIHALGFQAMDLWLAHLNPQWATTEHVEIAEGVLQKYAMQVISLAGYFGDDADNFESACQLANTLDTKILGGGTGLLAKDPETLCSILDTHDLSFGLENHPEKSARELLEKIEAAGDERVGAAIDSGWFASQGFSAAKAITELEGRIIHVHLKDIFPPQTKSPAITLRDMGHETCALGEGVVQIDNCLTALKKQRYAGPISIEHEPEDHDPTQEILKSLSYLEAHFKQ